MKYTTESKITIADIERMQQVMDSLKPIPKKMKMTTVFYNSLRRANEIKVMQFQSVDSYMGLQIEIDDEIESGNYELVF